MVDNLGPPSDGATFTHAGSTNAGEYTQIWRRSPKRVHRVLPGHVLVAAPGEQTLTLGGLAAAIWIVLNRSGRAVELIDRIADGGAGAVTDIRAVVEALELMERSGVLESTASANSPVGEGAPS